MNAEEIFEHIKSKAIELGYKENKNAILRKGYKDEFFKYGGAWTGFINPNEPNSGAYSDFSFVVFPEKENGQCVVALGVGSAGFQNDYMLADLPGLRRKFINLLSKDDKSFCKSSFLDIESPVSKYFKENLSEELLRTVEIYKNVLSVCRILETDNKTDIQILDAWLAIYANIRDWGTKPQKKKGEQIIQSAIQKPAYLFNKEKEQIKELLKKRKFVILQGAPGTGKTYITKEIAAEEYNKKNIFFTQFHAEVTYTDFVYGIEPVLNSDIIKYQAKQGILYQAIKTAQENKNEEVLLIIDEINRANLANVLGPIFYLFEYQSKSNNCKLHIGDLQLDKLPENLSVIATMNTADRSLAVVDFALRRRFAWYTMRPHIIEAFNFHKEQFLRFQELFEWYATDEELNLQPGHAYFFAKDAEEMKNRMIYELMPLMKEYFAEGALVNAKDEFCNYLYNETGISLYE